jgi:hypothetical protein
MLGLSQLRAMMDPDPIIDDFRSILQLSSRETFSFFRSRST